jgi:hypothetical protein
VNHAFIAGPAGQIVEATPRGVHVSSISEYAGCLAVANLDEEMTPAQGSAIWEAALAMAGAPYAFPDLLALGAEDLGVHWRFLFWLLGKPPWRICSQLVCIAGQKATPPMPWLPTGDLYADQVTPAQLAARPGVVPVTIG